MTSSFGANKRKLAPYSKIIHDPTLPRPRAASAHNSTQRAPSRARERPNRKQLSTDTVHSRATRHVASARRRRRRSQTRRASTVLIAAPIRERSRPRTRVRERGAARRSDRDAFFFSHDRLERADEPGDGHAHGVTGGDWCALGCLVCPRTRAAADRRRSAGRLTNESPRSRSA